MRHLFVAFLALSCSATLPAVGQEKSQVTLDVASTFPSHMPILGDTAKELTDRISRISGREIALKFHEPGELIPAAETVKGVAKGTIPAAWAGAGWLADVDSAFNLFSAVPFGPDVGEYMAWLYHGGGLDMAREMFHQRNVHNIPCTIIPPEASGWFQKEIRSVEDLKGLRMRIFGLGRKYCANLAPKRSSCRLETCSRH
jgi:TRAP-type mannitol/chloroaromatic compound transport system substrate-binding protein